MGKLSIFTMGHVGVVLDPQTLEPRLPLEALALAQNAVQDPKEGHGGAIRKRPGLARFNIENAGGIILGGIPMPVAGFGGAPVSGGGATLGTGDATDGTSVGTGDMTGSPGGTFDGGAATTTPPGAGAFGGSGSGGGIFGGARLLIVGRNGSDATVSQEGGSGWYVSSKGLANAANIQITPGPPICAYDFPPTAEFPAAWGTPSCIDNIGSTGLYYVGAYGDQLLGIGAGTTRTVGTGTMGLGIRRTTGGTDSLVATITANPSVGTGVDNPSKSLATVTINGAGFGYAVGEVLTVVGGTGTAAILTVATIGGGGTVLTASVTNGGSYTVLPGQPFATADGKGATFNHTDSATARAAATFLHFGSDGFIYLGIKDKYAGQPSGNSLGRVIRLSPLDGTLTEWNLGQVGEGVGQDGLAGHTPMRFELLPYCGCYFDGYLWVGTFPGAMNEVANLRATDGSFVSGTIGGSFVGSSTGYALHSCMAVYNGRLFLGTGVWETTPSFAGVWSRSPVAAATGWAETFRATGGAATNGNYFPSMVVFNGALYAQFYNPNGPTAKVYKIVANNVGDPLSMSFTVTTALAAMNGIPHYLFVDDGVLYAIGAGDTFATSAWTTTDGATWTERTANLPAGATNSRIRPVFFGVNQ